jgi:hypothetical protein
MPGAISRIGSGSEYRNGIPVGDTGFLQAAEPMPTCDDERRESRGTGPEPDCGPVSPGSPQRLARIFSVSTGSRSIRSATTPTFADWKMGALGFLLTASRNGFPLMPPRCWNEPLIPSAR